MTPIPLSYEEINVICDISLKEIAINLNDEKLANEYHFKTTTMEVYGQCAKLTTHGRIAYLLVPVGFKFRGTSAGQLGPITYHNITDEEFGHLIDQYRIFFANELGIVLKLVSN